MNAVKQVLDALYHRANVAGMSVAVTDRKGTVLSENYGVLSVEAKNAKTPEGALYRIASLTKIFAGLTVMKLVEDGKLDLDVPVKQYVPALRLNNQETDQKVTLRHLLSHTSGLPAEYSPDGWREESALKDSMGELADVELLSSLKEKKFCYSNWGIRLASFVAQEVTGEYFSQLAQRLIIQPLGMERTTFDPLVALTYPTSLPHIYEDGCYKVVHRINENAARYAAGGLFSNTDDLCKLARFIMNKGLNDKGERILSEKSITEMFTKHAMCQGNYSAYGLTTMFFTRDGIQAVGHLGSHPPYATSLLIEPSKGYAAVTLMNTYNEQLRLDAPFAVFKAL